MATFTYPGAFFINGVGVNGAAVAAYKVSRFSSRPGKNATPPSGAPDATTTTSANFGFDGAFGIALNTSEDYYISIVYLGVTYWQGPVSHMFADGVSLGGSAAAGTTVKQMTGDAFPRMTSLADGRVSYNSPKAPVSWGAPYPGYIGAGLDFQWGYEGLTDTSFMHFVTFPRIHITDGAGNYFWVASYAVFPLTGSPTIQLGVENGSFAALGSSGVLTVSGVSVGTGTITHTGILKNQQILTITGATAGTFSLSIAGYTTASGIAWNASAATIQALLSDGVHGPANTVVAPSGAGSGSYAIQTAGQTVTATFSLTGGTPSIGSPYAISMLTGCSSTGLVSTSDNTARHAYWLTDFMGAPIMWVDNFGGLSVNDNIRLAANGVWPDNTYDIWLGFKNNIMRDTGTALFFGGDLLATIERGNDGFGNSQFILKTDGHAGAQTTVLDRLGLYSSAPLSLGLINAPWSRLFLNGEGPATYSLTTTGATAGTFSISVAGYTTASGIAWNASAATIQALLSDGVHGTVGTTVTGPSVGPGVYTIKTPTVSVVTAAFVGLTGGTPTLSTTNNNGLGQVVFDVYGKVKVSESLDIYGNPKLILTAGTSDLIFQAGTLYPLLDNTITIGGAVNRFANIYAIAVHTSGLNVTEYANGKQGVATLAAGTKVVANTSVTATSRIFLTAQSLGTVTVPKALAVTARTPGTSFTISSADATDTSVVAYEIFEVG